MSAAEPPSAPTPVAVADGSERSRSLLVARWAPAVVWLSLPLVAGPAFADALAGRSTPVVVTAQVGLWALWLIGLVAALAPSTVSLTTMRIVFPASLLAAVAAAAAVSDHAGIGASVALGTTSLATVVALWATVGFVHVNGSSYGDERRFPLRPPAPVVLGSMEVLWLVMASATLSGPMLLAARQWIAGAIVTVLAVLVDIIGVRALHQLSKRWLVFVPAGIVLVDRTVLLDAMLTLRQRVASLGFADDRSDAYDLGAGAIGVEVELRLTETGDIIPTPARKDRHRIIDPVDVDAVRFCPTRPGWVLDAARARRFTID